MLTASEGAIYQRFGFGVSTWAWSVEIDVRAGRSCRLRPRVAYVS